MILFTILFIALLIFFIQYLDILICVGLIAFIVRFIVKKVKDKGPK